MKTIVTGTCVALILILSNSCTKDTASVADNSVASSTISEAKQELIVGRQQVVQAPTGDYAFPTSQALLWLPVDYTSDKPVASKKKYPLLICLVGNGETGRDINALVTSKNVSKRIAKGWNATVMPVNGKDSVSFIVFTPQCPVRWGWSAPHIKNMLAYLKANYRVDDSRVYITGYSAGGWGLWSCITDDTSLCKQFAAIGPVCAAGSNNPNKLSNISKYNIACWSICGTADAFYTNAIDYTSIINSHNPAIKAKLTSLKGVGHSAWIEAYSPSWKPYGINFYQWLLQYHK